MRKSIKYLLPVVAIIIIIGLVLARVVTMESTPVEPEISITAAEASEHIGTVAEVCGEVVSADYLPLVGGNPTFLNFGEPHPNQHFTVVIWGENRHLWQTPPEEAYLNKEICASGEIQLHEGTPQIVVVRLDQIELIRQ